MFKKITLSLFLTLLLGLPISVGASGLTDLQTNLGSFGGQVGYDQSDSDLTGKIALIINIVLGFLGLLAVIMILFAGFNWMTAGGNEETVTKAKGTIKNAVIGIAIVLSAFIIVNFTVSQLSDTAGAVGEPSATTGGIISPTTGACYYTITVDGTSDNYCDDGQTQEDCTDYLEDETISNIRWEENQVCP